MADTNRANARRRDRRRSRREAVSSGRRDQQIARKRPAEKITGASGAALVAAYFLGVDDPEVMTALGAITALIPTGITWLVELFKDMSAPAEIEVVADEPTVDIDLLREYAELKKEGVITEEEFNDKKSELLSL